MAHPHVEFAAEIAEEEKIVERRCTVQEIFEEGFKLGLQQAGPTENAELAYKDWLLARSLWVDVSSPDAQTAFWHFSRG